MNNSLLHRSLVLTAWVAGLFCATVGGVMVYEHFAAAQNDPWKSPELLALKDKLSAEPKNTALQEQIRLMDLEFRQKFRRRLALDKTGGWLLMGGGLVLVLAAGKAVSLKKFPALPQPKTDASERSAKLASRTRWSVAGVAIVVAGSMALIRLGYTSVLPDNPAGWKKILAGNVVAEEEAPALAEFQTNWPRFRGWDGSGVSSHPSEPPYDVVWQSAIPTPGHSSPVIWGDHVFISGGGADRHEVFCYNASNGALLWRQSIINVPGSPAKIANLPEDAGCAAPTLAADGRRVYAIFGNGDLAALKFDGAVAWTKYLGLFKNGYGYATSLAIWGNFLLVQADQGDSKPAGSKIISLQSASGRVLWERSRPVTESWATPIIFEAAGKTQIITLGNPWVIAYTLADGNELWRAQLMENEVVPSPVFAGGLVVVVSPGAKLMGLRLDGTAAWNSVENVPDITSPVANSELAFTVTSAGVATCFQVIDGKKLWDGDVNMEVQASPGIMGGNLFLLGTDGTVVTLQAAREFHEIARTRLPDKFLASPAFAGGRIFLRGVTNLYSLGPSSAKLAKKP